MRFLIKRLFRKIGYEIQHLPRHQTTAVQLLKGLQNHHIDVVFDIGANIGQFAQELRTVGFSGTIISFEPLSEAHAALRFAAASDNKWHVHERGAIGDSTGEIRINIAGNSVSSSILPMLDAHSCASAGSAYVASETTPIRTLDSVALEYMTETTKLFVKIDTQGFEWQVLEGAQETLKQAHGLLIELSLLPLYDGQRLWKEVIDRIESEGFLLWAIQPGFIDERDGRLLQIDAIFFRNVT